MKRQDLQQRFNQSVLLFDGGFGSELYRKNFFVNTSYDALCITAQKAVRGIHEAYAKAGADVLTTNSYNANQIKLSQFGMADQVEKICRFAVALAKDAAGTGEEARLIAGSVGPLAETDNSEALKITAGEAQSQQAQALLKAGADFILFETISSLSELKTALTSAQTLPNEEAWGISFVFQSNAKLADEASLEEIVALLKSLPAEHQPAFFGLNCGTGPEATLDAYLILAPQLEKLLPRLPAVVQPAAGVPKKVDNRFMLMTTPEYFTTYALRYTNLGARGVGGCCGIGPEHIADLSRSLKPLQKTSHAAALQIEVKEENLLPAIPPEERSPLGKKLKEGKWLKLIEMTPPKGFDLTSTVAKAIKCKEAGFDALNIPDGPRASSRISQIVTAIEIQEKAGMETIVHCCARDRNLISLQSMILGCMAKKLHNILFITGDPPKLGDYPFSSGVFDVDSIGMLKLQTRLNQGIDVGGLPLGGGEKTAILAGAGTDPNAIDPEREYRRLCEKIEAGANFIITQPVFDPEVLGKFLKRVRPLGCPVIAGVWPFASYRNALFMKTEVPGVVVPDWIMDAMKNAGDKEAQRTQGIQIARETIQAIHDEVAGIATSAPLGNIDTAIAVCAGF